MASGSGRVLADSKSLVELFTRLQENLGRATDKNESLLEAIESSEARASSTSGEVPLLRNLRARLAAAHAPNSALRRDLNTFSGLFEKRFKELDELVHSYEALQQQLKREKRDLDERLRRYEEEREKFENERLQWKEELERKRVEMMEQNDRLTVLSEQLVGAKVELDARTQELASQRIAFEEERLEKKGEGQVVDSEAEELRLKLKEQVLHNVELESALLRAELSLHQREEALRAVEGRNHRLQRDVAQSHLASSRAVKQFEKRTAEANKKLSLMNAELAQAQEHARRFQELLAVERRKQKGLKHALEQELQRKGASSGEVLSPSAQRAYIETLSQSLSPTSKPRSPVRVEDVIRKSETIMVENANLRAEIRKLRVENSDLLRRVRFADTNAHYMRNQVVVNVSDRAELMKKLDKAEAQYRELEQSLMRQASDWVSQKQREAKTEKTLRLSQIEPIPVLGAGERTWNTPSKPQALSRSTQVHKWLQHGESDKRSQSNIGPGDRKRTRTSRGGRRGM